MTPPPPPYRVIVAGSRGCTSLSAVNEAMRAQPFRATEIVSGGARGVDKLGEQWARMAGVAPRVFPADWSGPHKKGAGRRRKTEMSYYADALVAIWDGRSPGTRHMIEEMCARQKPVFIYPAT